MILMIIPVWMKNEKTEASNITIMSMSSDESFSLSSSDDVDVNDQRKTSDDILNLFKLSTELKGKNTKYTVQQGWKNPKKQKQHKQP